MDDIKVASINCRGQTRLTVAKQLQIQHFISEHNVDIVFLQETNFNLNTFDNCENIRKYYSYISTHKKHPNISCMLMGPHKILENYGSIHRTD